MGNRGVTVDRLECIRYPDSGPWVAEVMEQPSWESIVRAVERLDRAAYPMVYLHLASAVGGEHPVHALEIVGGRGEYAITVWLPDEMVRFTDPNRVGDVVDLLERDQGAFLEAHERCTDLSLVLTIADHFSKTGQPYEQVAWERELRI